MTADGGVSSAESTVDGDLTTNTESEDEQHEGLGSCDEAAVAQAEHLQATERAGRVATKLARRLVKAWLWHDKDVMEAAVRQLQKILVTRQVVFGSGLMQVLQMRRDTLWNVLSDGYRTRVAQLYSEWLRKLKEEKDADLDGTEIKAKSLQGAYANCPTLFLKRCQEFGH